MMVVTKDQLKEAVMAMSDHIDMATWAWNKDGTDIKPNEPLGCGTTMCVAGLTCHIAGATLLSDGSRLLAEARLPDGTTGFIADMAQKLLQITSERRTRLFDSSCWPGYLHDEYVDAKRAGNRVGMAEAMCKAIDRYVSGQEAT